MPLAPEVSAFGDGNLRIGQTGITLTGGGFGAFPGSVWISGGINRTGNLQQCPISGNWNDIEITGIRIPPTSSVGPGTRYVQLRREDLAWSQSLAFTLTLSMSPGPFIDFVASIDPYIDRFHKSKVDLSCRMISERITFDGRLL